jgi:hypothetical protein
LSWLASNGKVSNYQQKGYVPYWSYKAVLIYPKNTDTLRMVLQIANFVHSKGGIKSPITIGI